MKNTSQNYVVSANGSIFGAYAGVDARAALLAHVNDAGYKTIEDAAAAVGENADEFVAGTTVELLVPLKERIGIASAALTNADAVFVAFDMTVDGAVVCCSLEWLDDELCLVSADCHLDVNSGYCDTIADALGDEWTLYEQVSDNARRGVLGDIAEIVADKLDAAVKALVATQIDELSGWWSIAQPNGEAVYGWGTDAEVREYCELLDERKNLLFDLYEWRAVSLADALSIVDCSAGFALKDAIDHLKEDVDTV